MKLGLLLSPWIINAKGQNILKVMEAHSHGPPRESTYSDTEAIPPVKLNNDVVWSLVSYRVDDTTYSEIAADTDYFILITGDEDPETKERILDDKELKITGQERNAFVTWWQAQGHTLQELTDWGLDDPNKTKKDIENLLRQVLASL